jgi:hypothetical protein
MAALPGAIFGFDTQNLGDDVQSYGSLLHLPRVAAFVDRDRLDEARLGTPHVTLLNSWFKKIPFKGKRPSARYLFSRAFGIRQFGVPNSSIRAVPFGFYLGRRGILRHGWLDYLKSIEPIGCRNEATVELLTNAGIKAHVTGCISMFIGGLFSSPEERSGTLLIDVDPELERRLVPSHISKDAIRLSNRPTPRILNNPWLRLSSVAQLLSRLRTAEFVVTSRFHVALPCIGFRTPVVLLADPNVGEARKRARGFQHLIPIYFTDEVTEAREIDWGRRPPGEIPDVLKLRYLELNREISQLCGESEDLDSDIFPGEAVRLRNVGLGAVPQRITLELAGLKREIKVKDWTSQSIRIDLPHFAGIERFAARVLSSDHRGEEIFVGNLDELLIPWNAAAR